MMTIARSPFSSHDGSRCPTCTSPRPGLHPAMQHEGEVQICPDPFHSEPSIRWVETYAGFEDESDLLKFAEREEAYSQPAYMELVRIALEDAGRLQEFLWAEESWTLRDFDKDAWVRLFQKRVDKISQLTPGGISWRVELRKRLLQQAALSIKAILVLDRFSDVPTYEKGGEVK